MTLCSDLAAVAGLALLVSPAGADPLASDAFGLFDPATSAPERSDWAGWRDAETLVPPHGPDRLVIFAGPKSLVAGKDPGHVVAIAMDRHGNLIADGTESQVAVAGVTTPTTTRGGIADLLLSPQSQATDLFVGVSVGERQSPKAMLTVTADLASIRPELTGPLTEVESDTAFELSSLRLVDRFGNPAPDGTAVTTILRHADGSFSLSQGIALQDSGTTRFVARDIPGAAEAAITLGQQTSPEVALSVRAPAAVGIPALELLAAPDIAATRLTLGPFLTTAGHALADGAQVQVAARLASGESHLETAWIIDGEVSLLLPFEPWEDVVKLEVSSPLGSIDLVGDWHAASKSLPRSGVTP